jgi:hypothetical protein
MMPCSWSLRRTHVPSDGMTVISWEYFGWHDATRQRSPSADSSRVRYARTAAKRGSIANSRAVSIEWSRWLRSIARMESRMSVRCVWCSEALRMPGACAEVMGRLLIGIFPSWDGVVSVLRFIKYLREIFTKIYPAKAILSIIGLR